MSEGQNANREAIATLEYFIDKFEKIPEENWHVENYFDYDHPEKRCALGHCGMISQVATAEGAALIDLTYKNGFSRISSINDGKDTIYTQPTPKQRVLAYLRDKLKEKGNG